MLPGEQLDTLSLPLAVFADGSRLEAPETYIERTAGLDRSTLERARASRICTRTLPAVLGSPPTPSTTCTTCLSSAPVPPASPPLSTPPRKECARHHRDARPRRGRARGSRTIRASRDDRADVCARPRGRAGNRLREPARSLTLTADGHVPRKEECKSSDLTISRRTCRCGPPSRGRLSVVGVDCVRGLCALPCVSLGFDSAAVALAGIAGLVVSGGVVAGSVLRRRLRLQVESRSRRRSGPLPQPLPSTSRTPRFQGCSNPVCASLPA
jgi:hypothetical protein